MDAKRESEYAKRLRNRIIKNTAKISNRIGSVDVMDAGRRRQTVDLYTIALNGGIECIGKPAGRVWIGTALTAPAAFRRQDEHILVLLLKQRGNRRTAFTMTFLAFHHTPKS